MTDAQPADTFHADYEPPSVTTVGTLDELTQGAGLGEEDGFDGFDNSAGPS